MTTIDATAAELPAPSTPPTAARRRIELLVGGVAFAAYARTLLFGFVYDDTTVIRSNPQIQSWSAMWHALAQPYWGAHRAGSGLYRPLFVSTLGALWNGTNHAPIWFHLFAVLLHVAATIAVLRLASRAVERTPAVIGALWFAVQPVHVEAIASVANTSEIIVALLALSLAWLTVGADGSRVVGWRCAAAPWIDVTNGDLSAVMPAAFAQYAVSLTSDGDVPTALDSFELQYVTAN